MNVFQAVKESVSTRKVAEAYGIRVNRSGMACCPFHDDHTPSLKLDQRYHCFGCGADGDVIDFTAQLFGIGKKEAAVKLASDFSISYDDGRMSESDGKSNAKGRKKKVRRFSPEYRFAETERPGGGMGPAFYRLPAGHDAGGVPDGYDAHRHAGGKDRPDERIQREGEGI